MSKVKEGDTMTAREELEGIAVLAADIEIILKILARQRKALFQFPHVSAMTAKYGEHVGHASSAYDWTEEHLQNYLNTSERLELLERERERRIMRILAIPYVIPKRIVYMRFVDGTDWPTIAESVHVSERHAMRLMQQGIESYAENE